jgi:hypothetical protein
MIWEEADWGGAEQNHGKQSLPGCGSRGGVLGRRISNCKFMEGISDLAERTEGAEQRKLAKR